MGKRGHSEEEILRVLREAESGETVVEVCRKHGISQQSFYLWKINTLVERARYSSHCSASLFFWLCSSSVLKTKRQFAVKDREHHVLELMFQFRIVAITFIAHKSVSAVDLDPLVIGSHLVEPSEDLSSSFERDVRILPAPDME